MSEHSAAAPIPASIRGLDRARPRTIRPSRVDELLEAIELALNLLRYDKTLRAQHPHAYADLERHHEAAAAVVEAASYPAAVRVGAGRVLTRRPLDNATAEAALTAIGRAYGVDL